MNLLDNNLSAYSKDFNYNFDNDIMLKYYPSRVIEKMNTGSALELGIGHGYSTREFLKHLDSYTVIEGSQAIIDHFKSNNTDLSNSFQIVKTYFEDYLTEDKFDNIIMGFILEHVENPDVIIEKYKKLLTDKGKIFIVVPNAQSLHRRIGNYAGLLGDVKTLSSADILLGHKRYYTLKELEKLAMEHGLKIISVEGILLKPFTTTQLQSLHLTNEIIHGMLEVGKKYPELSNAILMELVIE